MQRKTIRPNVTSSGKTAGPSQGVHYHDDDDDFWEAPGCPELFGCHLEDYKSPGGSCSVIGHIHLCISKTMHDRQATVPPPGKPVRLESFLERQSAAPLNVEG